MLLLTGLVHIGPPVPIWLPDPRLSLGYTPAHHESADEWQERGGSRRDEGGAGASGSGSFAISDSSVLIWPFVCNRLP